MILTISADAVPRDSWWLGRGKPVFDRIGAALLLLLLAPLIGALWLIVRRDGGPGFFGHQRVGRHGRLFRCWKIRSMVPDADARLTRHLAENPAAAAEWARDFKLTDDPRITRLGAFLRRSSLDELPQLWNVLMGQMSLVGPRPVTPAEYASYGRSQRYYSRLRPGLTGLWQVSGRNATGYRARVALDVGYYWRASAMLDLRILLATAGVVLRRTGC